MDNINDILRTCQQLIEKAFAFYRQGEMEEGDKLRTEANQLMDEIHDTNMCNLYNLQALYGENRNFGIITNVILENAAELSTDSKKLNDIKQIIKYIKGNKVLSEQAQLYNALCNTDTVKKYSKEFVNETLSKFSFNPEQVIVENEKLINKIHKLGFNELVDIDDATLALYEAVEYLMFNKQTNKNYDTIMENKNIIIENLESKASKDEKDKEEETDLDASYEAAIKTLSTNSTNEEVKLMSIIMGGDVKSQEALYNQLRNGTLKLIEDVMDENTDEENTSMLQAFIDTIEDMSFTTKPNKVGVQQYLCDITKFMEIASILENEGLINSVDDASENDDDDDIDED